MNTRIPFIAGFLVVGVIHLQAATNTVTSTADSGAGTLRDALGSAADGDTIDASGISGTITLTSGELLVTNSVDILGPSPANLAVDGNAASRVFHIAPSNIVTISSLTVTNGRDAGGSGSGIWNDHATLTVSNCTLSGNSGGFSGGGIYNDGSSGGSATLTVNISTLSGNSANVGGGIANYGISGGSATLTVNNSTLSGNSANSGGGILNTGQDGGSATLTVNNSTLSDNSGIFISNGGGIFNQAFGGSATVQIASSTLSGNSAFFGGGVANNGEQFGSATLTVSASTLSGNSADVQGGGIYNNGIGGSATLTVNDSTLSGNTGNQGGGIFNGASDDGGSATLTVNNSTLNGNSATGGAGGGIYNAPGASVDFGSTILNAGGSGENIFNFGGTVTSLGYNLSSDDGGGALTNTADQINTNAMLGPLQDNGGPTFTHALLTGSPAINAGDPGFTSPPNFDQRGPGFPRVVGGRIDIGAVEVPLGDLAVTMLAVKTKLKGKTQLTYTIPVQNFGPDAATGVVLTDPLPAGTTFLSVSSTQGTNSAPPVGSSGTVTCNLGSLSNGVTATVTIEVTITAKGKATITNTATVTSDTPDPTPGNNSATIQTSTTGK